MNKTLKNEFGIPETQADAMTADMLHNQDPNHALAFLTVAKMHQQGGTDNFAAQIGAHSKAFMDAYQQAGNTSVSLQNADPEAAKKTASIQRDALLTTLIANNPAVRAAAYKAAGLDKYGASLAVPPAKNELPAPTIQDLPSSLPTGMEIQDRMKFNQ